MHSEMHSDEPLSPFRPEGKINNLVMENEDLDNWGEPREPIVSTTDWVDLGTPPVLTFSGCLRDSRANLTSDQLVLQPRIICPDSVVE